MDFELTLNECRVIGCLLEKESTTPDQYPLTLNALTNACNQKSNREPVLSLTDREVRETLDSLISKRLVSEEGGARVSKFRHRFCNTEFSTLQFSDQQKAIVCFLLLRGPQTAGELRSRTGRMASFSDVREAEAVLLKMAEQELVVQLPREPGKRDSRFAHLFSGTVDVVTTAEVMADTMADDKSRIQELEQQVKILEAEVARLNGLLAGRD